MGNLFKSELYKLRKDRSFWTVIIILMIAAVSWPTMQFFDKGPQVNSGFEVFLGALGGNNYITKLAPCILAGFFISSEYSFGTMKSITASGNSRIRIFFAKLFVYSIGAVIISLIFPIIALGMGTVLFGFGELPQDIGIGYFVQTIGLLILYSASFASIMALFAIFLTDSGKTVGVLLIFFLMFDSLLFVLSEKFSIFKPVFNYSVFKMFLDSNNPGLENGEVFKLILVPILTFMAFGILGSLVFRRKEIK